MENITMTNEENDILKELLVAVNDLALAINKMIVLQILLVNSVGGQVDKNYFS